MLAAEVLAVVLAAEMLQLAAAAPLTTTRRRIPATRVALLSAEARVAPAARALLAQRH